MNNFIDRDEAHDCECGGCAGQRQQQGGSPGGTGDAWSGVAQGGRGCVTEGEGGEAGRRQRHTC